MNKVIKQTFFTCYSSDEIITINIQKVYVKYLGYLRITDFGIARVWKAENNMDTSGTPGYMGIFKY